MQLEKGRSGNPATRFAQQAGIAAEKSFDEDAEALTRVAMDLAKEPSRKGG